MPFRENLWHCCFLSRQRRDCSAGLLLVLSPYIVILVQTLRSCNRDIAYILHCLHLRLFIPKITVTPKFGEMQSPYFKLLSTQEKKQNQTCQLGSLSLLSERGFSCVGKTEAGLEYTSEQSQCLKWRVTRRELRVSCC